MLSQSTNDRNRDVAYFGLRERFPTWEQVRDAPVGEVELAIRRGGISKVKSARIKAILEAVTATSPTSAAPASASTAPATPASAPGAASGPTPGELSLDWLTELPVPEAQAYLCSLPGVGRKTAACVLLFSYGMRDVPVDTHVSRVGTRLGLLRPKAPFEELHDTMLALTPARAGVGAAPEPAAPRPPHLSRPAPAVRRLRAATHVPERRQRRRLAAPGGRQAAPGDHRRNAPVPGA